MDKLMGGVTDMVFLAFGDGSDAGKCRQDMDDGYCGLFYCVNHSLLGLLLCRYMVGFLADYRLLHLEKESTYSTPGA